MGEVGKGPQNKPLQVCWTGMLGRDFIDAERQTQ